MEKKKTVLFFTIFLICCFSAACADEGVKQKKGIPEFPEQLERQITEGEPQKEVKFTSESFLRYMPARRVRSQSGKVGIVDAASEWNYETKVFNKLPLEFLLQSRYIGIDNTTVVELPANLTAVSMGVNVTIPFFTLDKTYFRAEWKPSWFGTRWNFRPSSFRLPMNYFVIHQPNEQWTFIAGVAIFPDFESEVFPILGFIYKPNNKLVFNLVPRNPNITYALNEKIDFLVEGDWSSGEYEVDKDGQKNVVLQYKERHLGTGVTYKINNYIKTSLSGGGVFGRRLQYRDSLGKVDIKDGVYVNLRLEITI